MYLFIYRAEYRLFYLTLCKSVFNGAQDMLFRVDCREDLDN